MNKTFFNIKIIMLLIILLLLTTCNKEDANTEKKLNIVTTIGMIGDVAENIGGDKVKVTALMGPGIDPHLYKAKENDLSIMMNADIILYNGLHLEAKLGDVLKKIKKRNIEIVAVAESIDENSRIETGEGLYDPHVWMNPGLWKIVARRIGEIIIEKDPDNEKYYKKRMDNYLDELKLLYDYVEQKIETIPMDHRILVTAHDAFTYFGKEFGLRVLGIQGISTQSEASASDIQSLADLIYKQKIPALFVESTVPLKTIEALKEAVQSRGYKVKIGGELYSDAMGNKDTPEGTYIGMIKHNVSTIAEELK